MHLHNVIDIINENEHNGFETREFAAIIYSLNVTLLIDPHDKSIKNYNIVIDDISKNNSLVVHLKPNQLKASSTKDEYVMDVINKYERVKDIISKHFATSHQEIKTTLTDKDIRFNDFGDYLLDKLKKKFKINF